MARLKSIDKNSGAGDNEPLLALHGFKAPGLKIDWFELRFGEAWCILGANGAGLEILAEAIDPRMEQQTRLRCQSLRLPKQRAVLSFAQQQKLFERELRLDDTDFLQRIDPGTAAGALLPAGKGGRLIKRLGLESVLNRGYRQLSSGEGRKICLAQHLLRRPSLLVLEHPFDGLDQASRAELNAILGRLQQKKQPAIMLLLGEAQDIPLWCTHLALIEQAELRRHGPIAQIRPHLSSFFDSRPLRPIKPPSSSMPLQPSIQPQTTQPLILLRQGWMRYGEHEVFSGLDLCVHPGQHTLITGPNGCGKSSLLSLISGDHPLCYANNLRLFGHSRGKGESIWSLKKQMGIVSPELHRSCRRVGNVVSVVLSGLFDSIGLYQKPSAALLRQAMAWLDELGLGAKARRPFQELGYGEQRLALIGRALIKAPKLLILDEATQGLDSANRARLLAFLDHLAHEQPCTILYASHRQDEYKPWFQQHLRLPIPAAKPRPFRLTALP